MTKLAMRNLSISALVLTLFACSEPATYDLMLRGGTIIDGSNSPSFSGDVAIIGDRIAAVGDLDASSATVELDVSGLVVAPGFINIHSHAEAEGLPTAVNMLSQGVTSEIINADGAGALDLPAQLSPLEREGLAINVGAMIGFNSVWRDIVGLEEVRPSSNQIQTMQTLFKRV